MFKNPFSFEGRIRRTEYGLSFIIYLVAYGIVAGIGAAAGRDGAGAVMLLGLIPLMWFLWAQGAKRCHDVGNSGWFQLIPFYVFWLLFQEGEAGSNPHGDNPKGIQVLNQQNFTQTSNPQAGYQGGYQGGHNNPNTNSNYSTTENPQSKVGYKDGELYK